EGIFTARLKMYEYHSRLQESPIKPEEILIDVIRRLIGDARHIAVGANSPIPAAASFLARQERQGALVSLQQSPENNLWTDGGRELFDAAGQGRIDVFFFSGAQIDGSGNINLVAIGDYERPTTRFPGSYGSAYLYFMVPKIILFRTEHSRRSLVERVDFISAPGVSPPHVFRRGGPVALVTPHCHFAFDPAKARFRIETIHPGHSLEEVLDNTGFTFDYSPTPATTPPPSEDTLSLLRGPVAAELHRIYPKFAAKVFPK
ncbi:MAG TPA: CoA-transferase, partial [Stellaceae bacterium]|nr:CoA-transferase [Stellaceae bacterium]